MLEENAGQEVEKCINIRQMQRNAPEVAGMVKPKAKSAGNKPSGNRENCIEMGRKNGAFYCKSG